MTAAKKYPSCRFTVSPPGVCWYCWIHGGPPVPGTPFRTVFPVSEHSRLVGWYCPEDLEGYRQLGFQFVPASDEEIESEARQLDMWRRAKADLRTALRRLANPRAKLPREPDVHELPGCTSDQLVAFWKSRMRALLRLYPKYRKGA